MPHLNYSVQEESGDSADRPSGREQAGENNRDAGSAKGYTNRTSASANAAGHVGAV